MSSRSVCRWVSLTLLIATPIPCSAWAPNGSPVGAADSIQYSPVIAADGAGGAFIVWEDWRVGPQTRTFVQHLTADGSLWPDWDPSGFALPSSGNRDHPVAIPDGSGGVYVADDGTHQQYITSTFGRSRLYRVGSDGMTAGGWPAGGIEVTGDPYGIGGGVHGDYFPALASDAVGGVYIPWTYRDRLTDNVKANHFTPDGVVVTGWHSSGEYAAPGFSYQAPVAACPDGFGGLFVAIRQGSIYIAVARFVASGDIAPGWPVRVAPNSFIQDAPGIVPDGAGGAIVVWQDKRNGVYEQTYAQHVLGNGSTAVGWPVDGVALSGFATDAGIRRNANYDASVVRYSSVIADAAGGAYIAWTDFRGGTGTGDVYLQHLGGNGSIAGGWPPGGLAIGATPDDQSLPTLAADGAGGVFVAWQDRRSGSSYDVYAQHVTAGGSIALGWVANGNPVSVAAGDQVAPVVVARNSARAIVAWTDGRAARTNVYAGLAEPEVVTATLFSVASAAASPGLVRIVWAIGGDPIQSANVYRRSSSGTWSLLRQVTPDGTGHVVLEDRDVVSGARYGYRLGSPGSTGEVFSPETWLDVPGVDGLALTRTWPNPASERLTVSFSLPTSHAASIALMDVSGRKIAAREVGSMGPGSHAIDFAGLRGVQPGVYLVGLTQGSEARMARVWVMR